MYNREVAGGGKLKTDLTLMLIDMLDPKRGSESRVQAIGEDWPSLPAIPFRRMLRLYTTWAVHRRFVQIADQEMSHVQ